MRLLIWRVRQWILYAISAQDVYPLSLAIQLLVTLVHVVSDLGNCEIFTRFLWKCTVRRKFFGENIDEFDEFPAIRQYFPYQKFPFS